MTTSPVNIAPSVIAALLQGAVAQSIEQAVDIARLNLQIQTGAASGSGQPPVSADGLGELLDVIA